MAIFHDPIDPDGDRRGRCGEAISPAEIEPRPIRVAFSAVPTLLAVVDAVCGRPGDVPVAWVKAVRSRLTAQDAKALWPLVARPDGFVPDCLLALSARPQVDPTEVLAELIEHAGETLPAELAGEAGRGVDGPWVEAARDPRGWAFRYARALRRVWIATGAEIGRASTLIDREIERVGAATARGALATLFCDLHPHVRFDDYADTRTRALPPSERGLTLIPKLTGPRTALIKAYRDGAPTHLAYPLPGATRALGDDLPAPYSLESLLGAQRTRLLRLLDRPQTIGRLAGKLVVVPATASHHTDALEAAGLVTRERRGRNVLVRRTARGSALLALYE